MDKKEFANGIKKIELAYNTKFTNEKLDLWYSKLKDMDYSTYIAKIENLIETSKFVPSIADIKGTASRQFANYEQREHKDLDYNSLYANKQRR